MECAVWETSIPRGKRLNGYEKELYITLKFAGKREWEEKKGYIQKKN